MLALDCESVFYQWPDLKLMQSQDCKTDLCSYSMRSSDVVQEMKNYPALQQRISEPIPHIVSLMATIILRLSI